MIFTPLIQTASRFQGQLFKPVNNRQNFIFIGIMLAFLLLLIAVSNLTGKAKAQNGKGYSRRRFRKEGQRIGLNKKQIRLLESFVKIYQVTKPFALLKDGKILNTILGQTLKELEQMEAPSSVIENKKLSIYQIKQKIERISLETDRLSDTKKLKVSQKLTFQMENGSRYPSEVTSNTTDFYCVKQPVGKNNLPIKWSKGSKITLLLWGKDGKEYGFYSKILGYKPVKGINSIFLQHSSKITRAQSRRFKRKDLKRPCYFFPIQIRITGKGRRERKEAVVLKTKGQMGTITNLSSGGCAIQTTKPLKKGDLLRLNFEPVRGNTVVIFGKIVDNEEKGRLYTSMHVMFTKASCKNLNKINECIYEFN